MVRKIVSFMVHILFVLLFIGTVIALGKKYGLAFGNILSISQYSLALGFIVFFWLFPLFASEYFLWRSTLFIISHSPNDALALHTTLVSVIVSVATILYMLYCIYNGRSEDNTILWLSVGAQVVCRIVVRHLMEDYVTDAPTE